MPKELMQSDQRQMHTEGLGLDLDTFDRLVASSNSAYDFIKARGPFFGKEDYKEPSFRIAAEPVRLPFGSRQVATHLGNDLLSLARALPKLPPARKAALGTDIDFKIPPTWRVDMILDQQGNMHLNEVEGLDGASALMTTLEQAYGLQPVEESTAAKLIPTIKEMVKPDEDGIYRLAYLRVNNSRTPNARRFNEYITGLSDGTVAIDTFFDDDIQNENVSPDWSRYSGVMNDATISPSRLYSLGVNQEQVIQSGNHNAIVNKGVLAQLFDESLREFWIRHLGEDSYGRLRQVVIPSRFITSPEEFDDARRSGSVVKASWVENNTYYLNLSKGVALPVPDLPQGSDDQWQTLAELLRKGSQLISQDYVEPARIHAFLRKKGKTLTPVDWRNRVSIKYVVGGNPDAILQPHVDITATTVTLGPNIIPAGKDCVFTAGVLQ